MAGFGGSGLGFLLRLQSSEGLTGAGGFASQLCLFTWLLSGNFRSLPHEPLNSRLSIFKTWRLP